MVEAPDPLYQVLLDHLEAFLAQYETPLQDGSTPPFLRREVREAFEEYLRCGVLQYGFETH